MLVFMVSCPKKIWCDNLRIFDLRLKVESACCFYFVFGSAFSVSLQFGQHFVTDMYLRDSLMTICSISRYRLKL